jgi:phospholipid/cholesterol/gamma-HCH transport system substrate-binding protein
MPVQKQASWARLKVGILALFAMSILAVLIFLITGSTNIFESNVRVYTYMADAAALTTAAPVNLDGILIGKIKTIRLSGSKDPKRLVRLEMEIPEHTLKDIPTDSMASISAANVLGTKYINIKTGKAATTISAGSEIPSMGSGEFEDLIQQGLAVMGSVQETIQRIDKVVEVVESGKGTIGKLLVDETLYNNLLAILAQVKQLADVLNSDNGTVGKLIHDPELYNQVHTSLNRLDDMLQQLQAGQGSAGKFLKDPAVYDETQKTIAGVHKLVDDLNAGKGTAGQLLKNEDLSNQLKATVTKIDSIIDKVASGQGTIGQLLVNQQLYDNLNGATREMHLLMKDFRANPKKFLRIKLSIF